MHPTTPPPWLAEACPPWCVVMHEQRDHVRDRRHVSASLTVPVTELRGIGDPTTPEEDQALAEELALCLHRRVGSRDTWLYVGDGRHQGLELSTDSWARVVPAVDRMVATALA